MTISEADLVVEPSRQARSVLLPIVAHRWPSRAWCNQVVPICVAIIIGASAVAALAGGLALRNWLWANTASTLRFHGDIANAWNQGTQIRRLALNIQRQRHVPPQPPDAPLPWPAFFRGYLAMYTHQAREHLDDRYSLDYAPLRLLIMSAWTNHELNLHPDQTDVDDPVSWPLLMMNTLVTLVAVVSTYALVAVWIGRAQSAPAAPPTVGWRARWRETFRGIWTRPLLSRTSSIATVKAPPRRIAGRLEVTVFSFAAIGAIYLACAAMLENFKLQSNTPPSPHFWLIESIAFIAALLAIACSRAPWRRHGVAMLTALALWFDPALLLDTHIWPQWDIWAIATYLLAVLLISLDCGFAAGIALAFGAMFKAQVLLVAPALVLWPLFSGRWLVLLRLLIAFAVTFALCGSAWLAPNGAAWTWIFSVCCAGIIALIAWHFWRESLAAEIRKLFGFARPVPMDVIRPSRAVRWNVMARCGMLALLIGALCAVCFLLPRGGMDHLWLILLLLAIVLAPILIPRRQQPLWFTALFGIAICLTCAVSDRASMATTPDELLSRAFGGTLNWLWVGFFYGTRHYLALHIGGTTNLATILQNHYEFNLDTPFSIPLPWSSVPLTITAKPLLITLYSLTLLACAVGAAMQSLRRDPRVLMALSAPWLMMFTLLPQMHERYGIFAGCVCCIGLAAGAAPALLSLLVMASAMIPVYLGEEVNHPGQWPILGPAVQNMVSGAAWMMLLIAATYLWIALTPRRREKVERKK